MMGLLIPIVFPKSPEPTVSAIVASDNIRRMDAAALWKMRLKYKRYTQMEHVRILPPLVCVLKGLYALLFVAKAIRRVAIICAYQANHQRPLPSWKLPYEDACGRTKYEVGETVGGLHGWYRCLHIVTFETDSNLERVCKEGLGEQKWKGRCRCDVSDRKIGKGIY